MRRLAAALALFIPATAALGVDAQSAGREMSDAFLGGNIAAVWVAMTPQMQQAFGSAEDVQGFRDEVGRQFGTETAVLDEAVQAPAPGIELYVRTSAWSSAEAPVLMQWAFDADGRVAGFSVTQKPTLAESRFLDYRTKATLHLPFRGEWFVVWGGRTLEQNYHAANRAQRFAFDFVISRDGATHGGDAARLDSYYCWDQPILAPGAGVVAAVTADLPDNPIGTTDPRHPAGNHVVIDLGNGEFAFLAHMQEGSITVAVGDRVVAGDTLGRCGNSGNTSEPHLHMHLQTTTDLANGEGLPAQFVDYVANGQNITRGEPEAGQIVSATPE